MGDFYQKMLQNDAGRKLLKTVGLPTPIELNRHHGQAVFFSGRLLAGSAPKGQMLEQLAESISNADAQIMFPANATTASDIKNTFEAKGNALTPIQCEKGAVSETFKALVFDATGLTSTKELKHLYAFFSPVIRNLEQNGRILILGRPHMASASGEQAAAMRALEGFSRSLSKEIGKKGATSQVVYVDKGAEHLAKPAIEFFLSAKSAYVNGQTVTVSKPGPAKNVVELPTVDWRLPLEGKTVLVTGGSRGIGEAIAETLARDGAKVFVLDIDAAQADLQAVADRIGGEAIVADITAKETPQLIADAVKESGLDIIVHNAGVTRDKMLANMPEHFWDMTLNINLTAEEEINDYLLEHNVINEDGRIICVSSMNGIAGQVGQSNYAASKAGVIGYVEYMAKPLAKKNITINAVAPGFIETAMTDAIPFMTREIGRRMNSLSQGGKPVDVAETISFFASPESKGISGNILRVCGQCLIGA
ncbi:3-oxoacyl-ACP reductase [Litoribrevibacter albus]|uniref:3-oxoacyl-ACP reductase n=1 Tax=Litoribrevibacter albus TaxID=1473156 RepID=A0AA37SCJ1_9GAMM|nr:3-oxoacyl-ACP reductase [Litoribrevibacter albus]GLQ31937.1 3-oxoacyl-ACP reductase [Litoribrevibacter albus]